jgi:hypothetical protein
MGGGVSLVAARLLAVARDAIRNLLELQIAGRRVGHFDAFLVYTQGNP